ncbi:MAG: metallophosphatase family protein [Actinomycetota bacterium]|nr:metallophosphatase family protein [Actinomycetota bacterium]MDQ2958257.1 metallophosphatase family protein [Actinomycetota bacterium]
MTDSTRIAVLSDIHGNLPALRAVLADVEAVGVDLLVLNGDLADGPFPVETLELLHSLGERAAWVRGNGDRWVIEAFDGTFTPTGGPADELIQWTASVLDREHRDLLAAATLTTSLELDGLGPVGFCHATARDDNEMVLVDSPISQLQQAFADFDQPTVVVGHCHMPFDRLFDRRRIVNAGAVGMPYGHIGASWALLGSEVTLRRTAYDTAEAGRLMAKTAMPDVQEFIDDNVCTSPSDAEALEVFGKIRDDQWAATSSD